MDNRKLNRKGHGSSSSGCMKFNELFKRQLIFRRHKKNALALNDANINEIKYL